MRRYDLGELARSVSEIMLRGHAEVLKEWNWDNEDMLILARMLGGVELNVLNHFSNIKPDQDSTSTDVRRHQKNEQIRDLQDQLQRAKREGCKARHKKDVWHRIAQDRIDIRDRALERSDVQKREINQLKSEIRKSNSEISKLKTQITRLKTTPRPVRAKVARLESEIQQYQQMLAEDLWNVEPPSCYYDYPPSPPTPEDYFVAIEARAAVHEALLKLTPREEKILRMRFGIGERSDHTLEEVGRDFEVTRNRIMQIESKALRKLRHPSRSKYLKQFDGIELPLEPPDRSKPMVQKRPRRSKNPHNKEQKVISLLRPMLKNGHNKVPHKKFVESTGINITCGQYARCQRTVLKELGRYEGVAKR